MRLKLSCADLSWLQTAKRRVLDRHSCYALQLVCHPIRLSAPRTPSLNSANGRTVARDNAVAVELFEASGGIYAADGAELWALSNQPKDLSSADRAYEPADELIAKHGLLLDLGSDDFVLTRLPAGGTLVTTTTDGQCSQFRLDTQAPYCVMVRSPGRRRSA
jgi:hypothetical protein